MRHASVLACLVLGAATAPAVAAPLLPGETIDVGDYAPDALPAGSPDLSGGGPEALAEASRAEDVLIDGEISGVEKAVAELVSSVLTLAGGTGFLYEFDGGSPFDPGTANGPFGFALTGFAGFEVDVAQVLDATYTTPFSGGGPSFARSADGDTITVFNFDGALLGGTPTDGRGGFETFLLRTDAPRFGTIRASADLYLPLFDGDVSNAVTTPLEGTVLGPAPIPLPAGGFLLAAALGGLMARRRRS